MSDSDESGAEKSAQDSGSDWSQAGKNAAAQAAEADDHDDDFSMADDGEDSPGNTDAGKMGGSSRKRQKPSPLKVSPRCGEHQSVPMPLMLLILSIVRLSLCSQPDQRQ